jgi:cell division transport system permease protein
MDEAKTTEERRGPTESVATPRRPEGRRDGGRRRRPARRGEPGEGGGTIVPPQSVAGRALVSVVAIMCFLACLAVGALSVVRDAAHDWQVDVSREATIQVKPIGGVGLEMRLARALALARETAGVRSARLVDERESNALL